MRSEGLIYGVVIVLFSACSVVNDQLLEDALSEAGDNAVEIEKVLDSFEGDKRKVSEFLVKSMVGRYSVVGVGIDSIEGQYRLLPNDKSWQFNASQLKKIEFFNDMPKNMIYDLKDIKSSYLINNINDAWAVKETRKWNKNISLDQFCELILPYRSGNERVTEWRGAYRKNFRGINKKLECISNSVIAAGIVSNAIGKMRFNQQLQLPHRTALDLLEVPVGYCRDDCDRTLYAQRAFGIPVTIDLILVSPDHGNSHMWNVVYDNEDHIYRMFDNYRNPPTRDKIYDDQRSKGKVYRVTTSVNFDRLKKYSNPDEIPNYLRNPRLIDVTAEYFGSNQQKIDINPTKGDVYLGIFTPSEFLPVDIAEKGVKNAIFRDIEPNIIYFPITKNHSEFETCGIPFMTTSVGGVHQFVPNEESLEKIVIDRKMPVTFNLKEKLSSVIGTKIHVGDSENGPWLELDSIKSMPSNNFYRVPFDNKKCKYIRISTSLKEKPELGEVIVSEDSLALSRLPLSYVNKKKRGKWENLVDGEILSWYHYVAGENGIILEIDSDKEVDSIFIVPRNDDNYVVPGEEYELFYFSENVWRSLGKKVANDFHIEYDVPKNAVLWLRNLTKGKEEQIFICRDGKQAFNVDLRTAANNSH